MQRLTFLGTSAGMPTRHRNVTGLAVSFVNPYGQKTSQNPKKQAKSAPWILIDCGEGTQHQLLKTPLSLASLQAICITHTHGDHCYGLAGLLSSMAMSGRRERLLLIAPQSIAKLLDTLTIVSELYFDFPIEFVAVESLFDDADNAVDNMAKSVQSVHLALTKTHNVSICTIKLSHRTPSYGYKISETIDTKLLHSQKLTKMGLQPSAIWGKLQHGFDVKLDNGDVLLASEFCQTKQIATHIIVGGDNDKPELLADFYQENYQENKKQKNSREKIGVLVHEATYTDAIAHKVKTKPNGFDPKHSSAGQVARFAQKMQLPNLILTHFSARFALFFNANDKTPNMGHIAQEVKQFYQGNYWLAKDFAVFEVEQRSVVKVNSKLIKDK